MNNNKGQKIKKSLFKKIIKKNKGFFELLQKIYIKKFIFKKFPEIFIFLYFD